MTGLPRPLARWPRGGQGRSHAAGPVDPLSSVDHGAITGPQPALYAQRRPPERPLLVPPQDAGPPPPFGLTASRNNIRSQLVPASVLQGHSRTTLDRLKAHLDLGSVQRVSPIT